MVISSFTIHPFIININNVVIICSGFIGIASKLIRPICEYMDRIGEDIYLETHLEERVSLYEHYGFELLEKSKVPHAKDIYLYGMIRRHKEKE